MKGRAAGSRGRSPYTSQVEMWWRWTPPTRRQASSRRCVPSTLVAKNRAGSSTARLLCDSAAEVHHQPDAFAGQQLLDRGLVADVTVDEGDAPVDIGEGAAVAGVGQRVEDDDPVVGSGVEPVPDEVGADEAGAAGDEDGGRRPAGHAGGPSRSSTHRAGFDRSRLGQDGLGDPPVGAHLGIVPRHAQLVVGVVVAVDQVGDGDVGEGAEAVGHARRDVQAPVVVLARRGTGGAAEVGRPGRALGGRTGPQVVQHHPRPAGGHVPVVGLVEVVRAGRPPSRPGGRPGCPGPSATSPGPTRPGRSRRRRPVRRRSGPGRRPRPRRWRRGR